MNDANRQAWIKRVRDHMSNFGGTVHEDLERALNEIENADALLAARVALARTEIVIDDLLSKISKTTKRLDRLEEYRQRTEGDARLLREKIETLTQGGGR